ncbi:MAG: CoB--CoM heterodisulfide reductase iron-sulfur subunit A family protein [Bacteroidales bacterium]|nr:CoB--CoM heterodisulfide reductase iron-sulfur subunit A family protein [Bacteroidales bacterium]MBP5518769.1 CoB--CoM heterodisulfide reductase iron-sulfur subunit A family protein [Bacteroidales bacterium]
MKKNILVIGGGPAGLEASANLKRLGYNVILIEKDKQLGGHLAKWDRLFPDGVSAKQTLNALLDEVSGVNCFTETEVQQLNVLEKSYNAILSNGITILADAVLLASGFDLFKAEKKEEYGYGIYEGVITNADLEEAFREKKLPAKHPQAIGFVHCVGSRDEKAGNPACSKVCCATAVKQACEVKEVYPDADVYCFYMDLRMFGRHYEDLYLKAQKEFGIRFIRGRVSEVAETTDGRLQVKAEDTLSSKPLKVTLDMLVLMAGMRPSESGKSVGRQLNLTTEEDGFFSSADNLLSIQRSKLPGFFYAGACTGAKTLPDTLHEARSAAIEIDRYIKEKFSEK